MRVCVCFPAVLLLLLSEVSVTLSTTKGRLSGEGPLQKEAGLLLWESLPGFLPMFSP